MLRKKDVCFVSVVLIIFFAIAIIYSTYALSKLDVREVILTPKESKKFPKIKNIENEIRYEYLNLNKNSKENKDTNDELADLFLKNTEYNEEFETIEVQKIWEKAEKWVTDQQIYNSNDSYIGNVVHKLKTAKIEQANAYPKGTQLKILLLLEGGQKAVFKPQWYDKEDIILGNVYAGNDRYGAEILSFYLSGILNLPLAPIATERIINLKDEITPVSTKTLSHTIFEKDNVTCVYGKCYYCSIDKPVCENSPGKLYGAIILHVPGAFNSYRSPWQRTYKKGKKALWETDENYCEHIKSQLPQNTLLDLVDTSIFDFLMQNGDRHHYETLNDKVLLLDNGKGLGNPNIHHIDILAPLYQCCKLRKKTWERLQQLSGGLLYQKLNSVSEIREVVSEANLKAIDKRLLYIYATVEQCKKVNKMMYF